MKNILKHYTIEQNFYNYAVIEKQHNKLQFKKVFRESAIARKDSIVKNGSTYVVVSDNLIKILKYTK